MSSINIKSRPGQSTKSTPPPCKYFFKGECSHGSLCRYSHDTNQLDPGQVEIVELHLSDLDNLLSEDEEDYNGPISISEANPEDTAYRKYKYPPTVSSQILSFKDIKSYNKTRLTPAYTHLQFGTGFPVTDDHIKDLLSCPQMLSFLEVFIIKGIDGTTAATRKGKKKTIKTTDPKPIEISNEPLVSVIRRCKSLRVLHLTGCINLDDLVFKAIVHSCPDLRELKITGIPTQPGRLTTACAVYLATRGHSYLSEIREIDFTNQSFDPEGITLLSDARPIANIVEGVQSLLPSKGVGLTFSSLEGTKVHHSSYIVAVGGNKLRFKDCYAPVWDVNKGQEPCKQQVELLLEKSNGPRGFWTSDESDSEGENWDIALDQELDDDGGIHRVEVVKGSDSENPDQLSDDLIAGLTEAIKRLHRGLDQPIIRDEDRFKELK